MLKEVEKYKESIEVKGELFEVDAMTISLVLEQPKMLKELLEDTKKRNKHFLYFVNNNE